MKIIKELVFNKPTDILITDPCYFCNSSLWNHNCDEEGEFNYIRGFYCRTLIGDWCCSVARTKKNKHPTKYSKILGRFAADAGMVCVVATDDLLKYNPNFLTNWYSQEALKACVTQINCFEGKIQFRVYENKNRFVERRLIIRGIGNINFESFEGDKYGR